MDGIIDFMKKLFSSDDEVLYSVRHCIDMEIEKRELVSKFGREIEKIERMCKDK